MSSFFAEAIETLEALVWAVNHGCGSPIPDDEYDLPLIHI